MQNQKIISETVKRDNVDLHRLSDSQFI